MSAENIQEGVFTSSAVAQTAALVIGERYLLIVGQKGSNFNSASLAPALSDGDENLISLPTPGSTDSAGSPVSFTGKGMVEFAAGDVELTLTPSGTLTDVSWRLVRVDHLRSIGKFNR